MMQIFNRTVGGKAMCKSLMDLERQNASMNMQGEMLDEQMDDAFDDDEDASDIDNVVSSVLLEAGIRLPDAMLKVPDGASSLTLEERLERLMPPVPMAHGVQKSGPSAP
jgi:hypothetical protein